MTPISALFTLSPLIGLLACIGSHIGISRLVPGMQRVKSILVSVGIGFGIVLALGLVFPASDLRSHVTALGWEMVGVWALAYVCLVYCYLLGFYVLGETARRIRLIVELNEAGERGMTLQDILGVYNARMIVEARLGRLVAGGQLVEREGRFITGNRVMLYAARTMVMLKLMFMGVRSESETS